MEKEILIAKRIYPDQGLWYTVYGIWLIVYGIWYLVYMVYDIACSIQYMSNCWDPAWGKSS